jgi:beta-carotene hydroxylase
VLRYKADIRTLITVSIYFTVGAIPWILWNDLTTWEIAVLFIINCVFSFICAVIIHNTIHVPMFYKKSLNKINQVVLTFAYGHPVSAYVPGHNFSHHKHTQTAKDSIRTTKARFKLNILNQLFFFYIMAGDILKAENRFVKRMYKERPVWFRQYLTEFILISALNTFLLFWNWKCFVLFAFIPHQYAAWGIVSTNYFQHDGCDENDQYNHSRNFTGRFFNYLTFNNGYHGAHHMKPGLHWSLLPQFYEEKLRPFIHPSLDRSSFIGYLWTTHVYPGKRIDYKGNPIVLAPAVTDEDWVADIKIRQNEEDMAIS